MSASIIKTPYTTAFYSGLLFEYQWQGNAISYSIPSGTAYFSSPYPEWNSWSALTRQEANSFRDLARMVNSYIDVSFYEVADSTTYGNIRVAYTNSMESNSLGYAYLPTPRFVNTTEPGRASGDIWLSPELFNTGVQPGQQLHHVLMHELGHALGLTHPFEDNAPFPKVAARYDNFQYTVMSYSDHPQHSNSFPITFMPMDILALQYLYGINHNHSPENSVYRFNNQVNIQTIWDPGGYNTLDFSTLSNGVRIDMREGSFSSAGQVINAFNRSSMGIDNLALAYGTRIHEVIGTSYDDVVTGNTLNNQVLLGAGNDSYIYVNGQDTVLGGSGTNTLVLPGQHQDWTYIAPSASDTRHILEYNVNSSNLITFSDIQRFNINQRIYTLDELLQHPENVTFIAELVDPSTPFTSAILTTERLITAEEAQLYRIYLGVLDRTPDQAGFNWWLNRYQQDATFDQLITGFYQSAEFRGLADTNNDGRISDTELLNHLYNQVLGREADQAGYNWWLNTLSTQPVSHTEVIFNFTQSDEYVLNTVEDVGRFLWV